MVLIACAGLSHEGATQTGEPNGAVSPGPQTWVVARDGSGQFTSIQEAIDQSKSGDTVEVRAGEYAEDVTIHSKERLKLIGAGVDRVIVLGRNRVGSFHIGKWPYGAADVEISGLTIMEHGGLALGIFNGRRLLLHDLKVKGLLFGQQVQEVRIERCEVGGSETTGVQFADSQVNLVANVIHDNDHGVTFAGKSEARLERNVITRNLFEGVVVNDRTRAVLVSNTIAKNGGGAAFLGSSRSEVSGNVVSLNNVGFLVSPTTQTTFSFNALFNTNGDYRVTGPPDRPAPELKGPSDLAVDPRFVDATRDDFRLRRDTPLVGIGDYEYLGALAPANN